MATTANKASIRLRPLLLSERHYSFLLTALVVISPWPSSAQSFLFFYPDDRRDGCGRYLGYGWAPVALWITAAALLSSVTHPRSAAPLLAAHGLVAAAALWPCPLAGLSYCSTRPDGLLENVSYGRALWGLVIGGPRLFIDDGVPLGGGQDGRPSWPSCPLVLYPRSIGPLYSRGLGPGLALAGPGRGSLRRTWASVKVGDGLKQFERAQWFSGRKAKDAPEARRYPGQRRERASGSRGRSQSTPEERTIVAQPTGDRNRTSPR